MADNKLKKCFVITPIGRNDSVTRRKIDGLIDEVLQPVLQELGYEVIVSHRITDSGTMTPIIIQNVYHCDLVIANLTGNNPNVMYEVAIRHASAKPIIHITENLSEIPFDINDQRTIDYKDDICGACELKVKLRAMVESINLEELARNPVTDALEKRDLVNVPKETEVELGAVLESIQNDIRMMKREMSNAKSNSTTKTDSVLWNGTINDTYIKANDAHPFGNSGYLNSNKWAESIYSTKPLYGDTLYAGNNEINMNDLLSTKIVETK